MKKFLALILSLSMVLGLTACGGSKAPAGSDASTPAATGSTAAPTKAASDYQVAMITDYGDITDQSFNQTTYEACKAFCEANNMKFNYFKPAGDSDAERVAMIESAVDEGYNVIVMPGYAFAGAIKETAGTYHRHHLHRSGRAVLPDSGRWIYNQCPSNLYCAVYQEELCGYMAGYAAVKLGYKHLGFLGGMAVPAVVRFGYGFVQGVDAAATEGKLTDVKVEYVYGNKFAGDPDITAYMDNWYKTLGVQAVFACGGGIYTSAAEAAAKVKDAKVIGVDTDQSAIIDKDYGKGMTLTSAMKGLAPTVKHMLSEVVAGNFANYGGKIETLGLVSGDDTEANYVQLPLETTQWGDGFTKEDYKALVADMFAGKITVSNDVKNQPAVKTAQVQYYDNIK